MICSEIKQTKHSENLENEEAGLVLEVVRAQRDVHRAQKILADCTVKEHERVADLNRFKAQKLQRYLDEKDLDVGWINAVFGSYGRLQPILPNAPSRSSLRSLRPDENGE